MQSTKRMIGLLLAGSCGFLPVVGTRVARAQCQANERAKLLSSDGAMNDNLGESASIRGNWDVLGLQSTGSVDYRVHDVHVKKDATFPFFTAKRRRGGPLYDLGVLCLTAAGHAAFAIGVTRRALDELMAIARTKQRMGATTALRDSELFLHGLGLALLGTLFAGVTTRVGRGEALLATLLFPSASPLLSL